MSQTLVLVLVLGGLAFLVVQLYVLGLVELTRRRSVVEPDDWS